MSKLSKALIAAAGNSGGAGLTVEDVFSTYLYEGNGSTQTITNGIDLAGEGGLVWTKNRNQPRNHNLVDTERGVSLRLKSNSTEGQYNEVNGVTSFNSDGYSLSTASDYNANNDTYASWTFRKAEKFFDVVTYTGNGAANRQVPHNLGSVPGCIILKRYDTADDWKVYHVGADATAPEDYVLELNSTAARLDSISAWNDTAPTDSNFTVNSGGSYNASGGTYVAYLFASDAGGFGDDGSENIIKCGSAAATGLTTVNCGFEPQWVLIKSATVSNSWYIFDSMRGLHATGVGPQTLNPNLSGAEYTESADTCNLTSTGFTFNSARFNGNATYIYIAIRRPMKTPESGTEVFNSLAYTGDGASTRNFDLGMTVDAYFQACRSSSTYDFKNLTSRLTAKGLHTAGTGTEFTTNTSLDVQDGLRAIGFENTLNQSGETYIINGFKRATGFFDVVAYTGNGVARTVNHNLGVTPELMIIKNRIVAGRYWAVYSGNRGVANALALNQTSAEFSGTSSWNGTSPTSSVFTVNTHTSVNESSATYIAYLFATLAGVSKVGSYTGNGTSQTIDCGFSNGARFILIKSTSTTGSWWVYDSARGIVAGNDPALQLNSTAAEVTSADAIDPDSSGFIVNQEATCSINANGVSYIFMSIA